MHIVLRSRSGDRDLGVDLADGQATLADVLAAAQVDPVPPQVLVDDRALPASCLVEDSGLHEGAVLATVATPTASWAPTGYVLAVLSGLDAGVVIPLPIGHSSLGRGAGSAIILNDPEVSRGHAEIRLDIHEHAVRVFITDTESGNGTWVDGQRLEAGVPFALDPGCVIRIGRAHYAVRPALGPDQPAALNLRRHTGPAGTVSFNRRPRPGLPGSAASLDVPNEPGKPSTPHFSFASTLGPIVLGVVLVAVTRDFRFALFLLLAPVVGVASYVESRRRVTRDAVREQRRFDDELQTLRGEIEAAGLVERQKLRHRLPDPVEVLRRAEQPSVRLWERRPRHPDFLQLMAGIANVPWYPPISGRGTRLPAAIAQEAEQARLLAAPVGVNLASGFVGIVGDRTAALAVARSLVTQAVIHHGPADLTIGVFVDEGHQPDWDWCKWLPHSRSQGSRRWLSGHRKSSEQLLKALAGGAGQGAVLVVLDSDALIEGQRAPARELLLESTRRETRPGSPPPVRLVTGMVVAQSVDRLPAACVTVIEVTATGIDTVVREVEKGHAVREVLPAGISGSTAASCARAVSRFDDPELHEAGASLPRSVRLLPMLDLDQPDAGGVQRLWRQSRSSTSLAVPLGVSETGVFTLDLVRDGPHGLIGGTTGSGKSELLRSLVAGLAAQSDPAHLTFALIDFKGGATFDACGALPHTVGLVTDLDEEAGDEQTLRALRRVLRSMEAELQYRERLLRSVKAENLIEYIARGATEPLPRLLIVVDEFGAMAEKLGDRGTEFLSSLVSVAQRGRTLGVHMILAAQKPSGVVNDKIRSNTNLRIALRVQDDGDSNDVIGNRDAAQLSRDHPGRAYVRLGPSEVIAIQTALVTCVTDIVTGSAVEVAPFIFGPSETPRVSGVTSDQMAADDAPEPATDLVQLVEAIVAANQAEGIAPPRKVWPDPLPEQLDLADLTEFGGTNGSMVVAALADNPARQSQYPVGWDLSDGNLLLVGVQGSGTTTGLASLALSLSSRLSPGEFELYALDFGAGELSALERLPHTGSVIKAEDRERQTRLLRHLRSELNRRRNDPQAAASRRRMLILVDNLGEMRSQFDDSAGLELMADFGRIYTDGPQLGMSFAIAADRWNTLPPAWVAVTPQRWLFRLGDRYDYVSAGLTRAEVPADVPGRAIMAPGGLQIQLGRPLPSTAGAADVVASRWAGTSGVAAQINALPAEVSFPSLGQAARMETEPWSVPFGVRESDLEPAELILYDGDHALIAGPARSGKSTTLWTLAESLRAGQPSGIHLVAAGGRRSPLHECSALDRYAKVGGEATAMLSQLHAVSGPVVVLIDDAQDFDDVDSAIAGLIAANRPDLHIITAANSDTLRNMYGHWTQTVRRSKVGLLLRPNIDLDGDYLGVNLPRRAPVPMLPGRGYLIHNGEVQIAQAAKPSGETR